MGGKSLKPVISLPLNVQKTAETVYDHTYLYSAVGSVKKGGHYVLSALVCVEVKGGKNDFFPGMAYHIQPVKKGIGIVINIGDPLASCCLTVKIPFTEMLLEILRYFFMSEIGNRKEGNVDQYQYKYDPARSQVFQKKMMLQYYSPLSVKMLLRLKTVRL